jgi:hypothetical protein
LTEHRPLDVTRKDGALIPKQRWLFDRLFAEGQEYTIEIHEPRSNKSHAHFFAVVREAWKNLPEDAGRQHPDPEHLRKWALIKTGWSIKRNVVCETVDMAHQVAAVAGQLDESAVIVVQGTVVTIATARTQKTTGPGAMQREEFQKSKQDVLDYVASLIGVDSATLSSQVSNSSDAQHQASDRTDTPAANGPQPNLAAGVSHSEASLLSDDWRDVYLQNLAGVRDQAASLLTRHTDAIQMLGGEPNEAELAWMRRAWRLVQKRNEGNLKRGEYEAEVEILKTMPLAAKDAA